MPRWCCCAGLGIHPTREDQSQAHSPLSFISHHFVPFLSLQHFVPILTLDWWPSFYLTEKIEAVRRELPQAAPAYFLTFLLPPLLLLQMKYLSTGSIRRKSLCKGPEAGMSLAYSRDREESSVAGTQGERSLEVSNRKLWARYGQHPAKPSRTFLTSSCIFCSGPSFCPQVPNPLCSSLMLALLGSAFLPLLCSLASLGNLQARSATSYAGSYSQVLGKLKATSHR